MSPMFLLFLLAFHLSSSQSNNPQMESCNLWLAEFLHNSSPPDCYCYESCLPNTDEDPVGLLKTEPKKEIRLRRSETKKKSAMPSDQPVQLPTTANQPKVDYRYIQNRCKCDPLCKIYDDCCQSSALLCPSSTPANHSSKSIVEQSSDSLSSTMVSKQLLIVV